MDEKEMLQYVKEHKEELKAKYDVVDVTVGWKKQGGELIRTPTIILWPKKKGEFSPQKIIPQEIEGMPTDVEEEVVFKALLTPKQKKRHVEARVEGMMAQSATTGKYRPLKVGCSIGNEKITAGTLGFLYKKEGSKFWLSNAHVQCTDPFVSISEQASVKIMQPGPYHGGTEQVGTLRYMILLNNQASSTSPNAVVGMAADGTYAEAAVNSADAALSKPLNEDLCSTDSIVDSYKGPQVAEYVPALGDRICYTTWQKDGYTEQEVIGLGKTVSVSYGSGKAATIVDCVMINVASGPGSSGSGACVILPDGRKAAVGLNFAGSDQYNIICLIQHINTAFGGNVVIAEGNLETGVHIQIRMKKTATGGTLVYGETLDDASSAPIAGCEVSLGLMSSGSGNTFLGAKSTGVFAKMGATIVSDANGHFEFADVAAGNYKAVATKDGYDDGTTTFAVP